VCVSVLVQRSFRRIWSICVLYLFSHSRQR